MKKIKYTNKEDAQPIVDERLQYTAGNANEVKEVVNSISDNLTVNDNQLNSRQKIIDYIKEIDDRTGSPLVEKKIMLTKDNSIKFTSTAQIFAIQFEGVGLLEIGTTQSCDDLGELQGEAGINTINFGISGISEMWLKSSVDKEITIIIYSKI